MKTFSKIIIILSLMFLVGCNPYSTSSRSSRSPFTTSKQNYSYEMVKDRMLFWSNVFSINKEDYHVYFFSRTCSHCESLKSFIIDYALANENIYFVESSEATVFIEDVSKTIGLSSIDGFGILGYPSLVRVIDKQISLNIAGVIEIKRELLN